MDKIQINGGQKLQGEVSISGAKNAALLAARMLAVGNPQLLTRLEEHRDQLRDEVMDGQLPHPSMEGL